jgi:copper chaperone CopZ
MKTILRSKEMTCPSCITKIEKGLLTLNGVETARVYFNTGKIEVEHNPDLVNGEDLEKAIRAIGYEARVSAF